MVILAGIDEAGLGPKIGPLATASAAFSVPDAWDPSTPWEKLADAIAALPARGESRPAIADSKILYTSGGMRALELALGAITLAQGESLPFLCVFTDGHCHPCYSRKLTPFPRHAEETLIRDAAKVLKNALKREKARIVHLQSRALFEPLLNQRFDSGLNKNQVLLMETGAHLTCLVETYSQPLLIMVDKQGGRNEYLPFLTALFPGAWIDTLCVGAEESAYKMRRRSGDVVIRFRAKADRVSFPTALASLAAKYTRERSMAELNAWFCNEIEGLKPTAGYPGDADRWLGDVKASGRAEALGMGLLIRSR